MSGLWEDVKTRKIFKAATIYAAVTWGSIQIADVLLPVLGVADWVMSSLVLLAFSGFPVALLVGWGLDIKHEREKLVQADGSSLLNNRPIGSRIAELMVIFGFSLGAAFLYYQSASEPAQATISKVQTTPQLISNNSQQKTIAVLPFANFTDSNEDEFFADGLSEELLNVLARHKKLRVAARTSSFEYKNTNINVKKIGEELGVQYILEGSVRRSGDVIRVTAQLIKADEDVHIFSKSWDRNTGNVFQVQDEIAQSVLAELKVSLLGEAQLEQSEIGTQNISAFAEYSRGMAFLRNRSKSDFENAIVHFNKALQIDDSYAEAMVMLAETYLLQHSYQLIEFESAHKLAEPLIVKAETITPQLATIFSVKGLMYWQMANQGKKESYQAANEDLELAKQYLSKAIDLNPSLAEAYMWYGSILQNQGDFIEGAKLREKAYQIDPRAAVVGFNRAEDLIKLGDYKQAMDVFNNLVRDNPNYSSAYAVAGNVSFAVGQLDQAYGMYNRLADYSDDNTMWLINSSRIFIPLGQYQLAQQNVDQLKSNANDYHEKYDMLQASIWIASKNLTAFNNWTESFKENTKDIGEKFWRGFASLNQQKWEFAIQDLEETIKLIREDNTDRVDEHTVRIQLFLARAYLAIGNQLKSAHYTKAADQEIQQLSNAGFNAHTTRYQQAALAAIKGEQQQALRLLRQSVQEGFVDFWWTEVDPAFIQLREDPAYAILRDEFGIRMRLMQNNIESQYGALAMGR